MVRMSIVLTLAPFFNHACLVQRNKLAHSCTAARHLRHRCRNPGSASQIVMLLSIESKLLHFLIFDCIFYALSLHNAGPGRAISGGFL